MIEWPTRSPCRGRSRPLLCSPPSSRMAYRSGKRGVSSSRAGLSGAVVAVRRGLSRARRRRFGSTRGPGRGSREARALQPPAESTPSSERTARPGAQVLAKRQLSPPVMVVALRIRPVLFLVGERARGTALCIRHRSFAAGQGFAAPSQVRAIRRAPPHHMRQRGGRQVWPRSVPRVGCGGR